EILCSTESGEVLELGGGSGRLAAGLLNALATRDAVPSRYVILEPSPDLRERQRTTIAQEASAHLARVEWIDALPASIDGVVLANEVLDAIPVHIVARRAGAWFERGVGWNVERSAFEWSERSADARLESLAVQSWPEQGDYVSEINSMAEALIEDIARRFVRGAALIIDYGFPAAEYYHPQRDQGTLMCHYRHRAHTDPFSWPGLTDITAHVDFTAIAQAAERG